MKFQGKPERRSVRIDMQFSGASWQCILVRRSFQTHVTVMAVNSYDHTVFKIERSYLDISGFSLNTEGWPFIDRPTFRIQYKNLRQGRFLSGFIEDKSMHSIQWDIQLFSDAGTAEHQRYGAQGRVICDEQEMLFPRASTIIAVIRNV